MDGYRISSFSLSLFSKALSPLLRLFTFLSTSHNHHSTLGLGSSGSASSSSPLPPNRSNSLTPGAGAAGGGDQLGSIASEGFRLSKAAIDVQDSVLHAESAVVGDMSDLLIRLRAEKISLTATLESNAGEAKRMGEVLQKTFQEITALQVIIMERMI